MYQILDIRKGFFLNSLFKIYHRRRIEIKPNVWIEYEQTARRVEKNINEICFTTSI